MDKIGKTQRMSDIVMTATCQTRSTYRKMTKTFDQTELELNEVLRKILSLTAATTFDTAALSCGTWNSHGE